MADRPIHLVLIDSDSIFRLGLQAALQAQTSVASVAVLPSLAIALARFAPASDQASPRLPDLVLLNLGSLAQDEGFASVERSLAQFRQTLPDLPLLGLEYTPSPTLGPWAQRLKLNGYWARGRSVSELVQAIEQVLRGQQVWTLSASPLSFSQVSRIRPSGKKLWQQTLKSGAQQIETRLYVIEQQRQSPQTTWLDQVWLAGWQRELRTTRWVLKQFGMTPDLADRGKDWEMENSSSVPIRSVLDTGGTARKSLSSVDRAGALDPEDVSAVKASAIKASFQAAGLRASGANPSEESLSRSDRAQTLQTILFDRISQRIPPTLLNLTDESLEIDILNSTKRQELIITVLQCFGELLLDMRLSTLEADFITDKRPELLLDLWQASLSNFLGRYSSLALNGRIVELLPLLLQEQQNIERLILNAIPEVDTIFGALLFYQPVPIDGVAYRPDSPEALDRLLWLTENLLITTANAVVQPLLNHVAEAESIRQTFYDKRLLSTREIEKFRNNLSWKYRIAYLFREAQDIYESRHWLLGFGDRGIEKVSVYAARRQELTGLTPLQQSVTLLLEIRDVIAPRLQFLTTWAGNSLVYVLTNVVGKGIGLIGLGIIQGVGSSIQDVRNLGKSNANRKP